DPSNIPHLAQNEFGASIGGPIRKNSTFFFANWEGFRLSNGLAQIETVPTAMEREGNFSATGVTIYDPSTTHANPNYNPSLPTSPSNPAVLRNPFPNDAVPSGRISSVATGVLAQVPLPNMASGMMGMGSMGTTPIGTGPDSNNYLDLRTNRNFSNQATLRLDQNLPHGDALFARYSFLAERDFTPENLPGFGSFDNNLSQNATLQYTHLISSASVNVLWLGMSRLSMHRYSQDNFNDDYITQLGIQGLGFGGKGAWGMPYVTAQGYNAFGDSYIGTPVHD